MGGKSPQSLPDFQRVFPNEEACYAYLYETRFPDGFMCPYCNWSGNAYRFKNRSDMLRCRRCKRDTRLTADTIMQKSKMPLHTWLWGTFLPRYIANSGHVCASVSEDARNEALRNSVQHAT